MSRRSMAASVPPPPGESRQVDLRVPAGQFEVVGLEPGQQGASEPGRRPTVLARRCSRSRTFCAVTWRCYRCAVGSSRAMCADSERRSPRRSCPGMRAGLTDGVAAGPLRAVERPRSKPRQPAEAESGGNSLRLGLVSRLRISACSPPQVALVSHLCLESPKLLAGRCPGRIKRQRLPSTRSAAGARRDGRRACAAGTRSPESRTHVRCGQSAPVPRPGWRDRSWKTSQRCVVHQPELSTVRGQPQVGVVGSQVQPVLCPGREQPVRLEAPLRHQVVDHDAQVALGS